MAVAIVGVGLSKFASQLKGSAREIAFESFSEAMQDAGLSARDVDCLIVSSSSLPGVEVEQSPAGLLASHFGTLPNPAFNVDAACCSSSVGMSIAQGFIESGMHDVIAIVGYQKIGPKLPRTGSINDVMWEVPVGGHHLVYFSMYSSEYMRQYHLDEDYLNKVTVKNRKYGTYNDRTAFNQTVSLDEVKNSPYLVEPIRSYTKADETEGAACFIVCSQDRARSLSDTPIWVAGLGMGTCSRSFASRESLSSIGSTVEASRQAFKRAKLNPNDIDVAAIHDVYPIQEILAYEDTGLTARGQAAKMLSEGQMDTGGKVPSNLDGGFQSFGHLPAANGAQQIVGLVKQLRGEAGKSQENGAETALAMNYGGAGGYATVSILKR